MVLLYTEKKQPKITPHFQTEIVDLDYQGFGVAKVQGKTWFIENALPTERVEVKVLEEKRQYGQGIAHKILRRSDHRQVPNCTDYSRCGGCQSQHIPLQMQREAKQKSLFQRLQKLQPKGIEFMPMIVGEEWQYRRRVRLSLNWNAKHKQVEMGFRQKHSDQIVSIQSCPVAVEEINQLFNPLKQLLQQYSQPKLLGHIELVAADNGLGMLLRYRQNLTENDRTLLRNFAEKYHLNLFLQDDQEIRLFYGEPLYYELAGLQLSFDIRDFIQVNAALNRQMVQTALDWLELNKKDNVLDLFCGMGNFTLPISRLAKSAVGIEGVLPMVEKAQANAEQNACHNVAFFQADLSQSFNSQSWATQKFNKILLDPPRAGADFALNALCELEAEKVLYVSCNPATLVRDAEILLNAGYEIKKTAMIDMFSHTGHLESITLFEKK